MFDTQTPWGVRRLEGHNWEVLFGGYNIGEVTFTDSEGFSGKINPDIMSEGVLDIVEGLIADAIAEEQMQMSF